MVKVKVSVHSRKVQLVRNKVEELKHGYVQY